MKKKIVLVSSSIMPLEFFLKEIIYSLSQDYEIIIITNAKKNSEILKEYRFIYIPISRGIKFFHDLIALIKFTLLIREIQPSLIISITPKGGFLSALSNILFRFRHLHFITGQNWINKKGLKRLFFKTIDKITLERSNFQLADSKSQIKFLNNEKFNINKIKLINYGSICGVDTNIFKPDLIFKKKQRKFFEITDNEIVILYLGRINKEKGVFKLYQACKKLFINKFSIKIFFVGGIEDNSFFDLIEQDKKSIGIIRYFNFTKSPENYMKIADIFCLPSSREGFGLSIIEASSTELPVLGSNIIGLEESIVNNETGLLFDLENEFDFYNKLKKLILSKNLREHLGINGRKRVIKHFKNNDVSKFITSYVDEILN